MPLQQICSIRPNRILYLCVVVLGVFSCHSDSPKDREAKKIELGRYLFYDVRLSWNRTRSCAGCHAPQFAFTDNYRKSITPGGERLKHNSPTLFNCKNYYFFDLSNPGIHNLEDQHKRPLTGRNPREMGFDLVAETVIQEFKKDENYLQLFEGAFGSVDSMDELHIRKALAAFTGSLVSEQSRYDAYKKGNKNALTAFEIEGMKLFFSARLHCSECHSGNWFTSAANENEESVYFNTGLYCVGDSHYPAGEEGLYDFSHRVGDIGKYRAPTLRNIEFTAPYFHDGSAENLHQVIDVYRKGGRNNGVSNLGDGRKNRYRDSRIRPVEISMEEEQQLIAFLYSLSDSAALRNLIWSDPRAAAEH